MLSIRSVPLCTSSKEALLGTCVRSRLVAKALGFGLFAALKVLQRPSYAEDATPPGQPNEPRVIKASDLAPESKDSNAASQNKEEDSSYINVGDSKPTISSANTSATQMADQSPPASFTSTVTPSGDGGVAGTRASTTESAPPQPHEGAPPSLLMNRQCLQQLWPYDNILPQLGVEVVATVMHTVACALYTPSRRSLEATNVGGNSVWSVIGQAANKTLSLIGAGRSKKPKPLGTLVRATAFLQSVDVTAVLPRWLSKFLAPADLSVETMKEVIEQMSLHDISRLAFVRSSFETCGAFATLMKNKLSGDSYLSWYGVVALPVLHGVQEYIAEYISCLITRQIMHLTGARSAFTWAVVCGAIGTVMRIGISMGVKRINTLPVLAPLIDLAYRERDTPSLPVYRTVPSELEDRRNAARDDDDHLDSDTVLVSHSPPPSTHHLAESPSRAELTDGPSSTSLADNADTCEFDIGDLDVEFGHLPGSVLSEVSSALSAELFTGINHNLRLHIMRHLMRLQAYVTLYNNPRTRRVLTPRRKPPTMLNGAQEVNVSAAELPMACALCKKALRVGDTVAVLQCGHGLHKGQCDDVDIIPSDWCPECNRPIESPDRVERFALTAKVRREIDRLVRQWDRPLMPLRLAFAEWGDVVQYVRKHGTVESGVPMRIVDPAWRPGVPDIVIDTPVGILLETLDLYPTVKVPDALKPPSFA